MMEMLRDRWYGLSLRERRLLIVGAAAVLLFLMYLLLRGSGDDGEDRVELAAAPPPAAVPPPTAAPPPTVAPAPPGMPIAPPPAMAAPAPSAGALVLYGVVGGGPGGGAAVIGSQDAQRLVRVGRPVAPGVILKEVGMRYAVLTTPTGEMRLELAQPIVGAPNNPALPK